MPDEWRIDVHHHVLPPQYVDTTPMPVRVPDVDAQLEQMERVHIRAALTSLTPRVLDAHPDRLREVARRCNEFQAGLVQTHPSHFGAFALLPLPDVDGALDEIAYALDVLKLDGVGLFSSSNQRYLGDSLFAPVFEELNRRRVTVFMHPAHCCAPDACNLRAPDHIVEYVFDTTRAIVNLLFERTLEANRDVRMIVSHAGGAVPYLTQRISGNLQRGSEGPDIKGLLRGLYYDVASAMNPFALRSLQELADPTHVLWGSDMPFVQVPRLQAEIDEWEAYDGFNADERAAIEHGNAARLFPRFASSISSHP